MKCPVCGHWNRASFPRCFRCGEPLAPRPDKARPAVAKEKTTSYQQDEEIVIRVDEYGNESVQTDKLDKLALEMLSLHERKRRGEIRQKQLRSRGAKRGFAPSGSSVSGSTRRSRFFADPAAMRRQQNEWLQDTPAVDYDGFVDQPTYHAIAGDDVHYNQQLYIYAGNIYLSGEESTPFERESTRDIWFEPRSPLHPFFEPPKNSVNSVAIRC